MPAVGLMTGTHVVEGEKPLSTSSAWDAYMLTYIAIKITQKYKVLKKKGS